MSTLEGEAQTIFCRCSNCGCEFIRFRFARNYPTGRFSFLYREAQLALRGIVGTRELDVFLADKDAVTSEFEGQLRRRADDLGLEVISVGALT